MKIDGAPGVAFELELKEADRIRQRRALGEDDWLGLRK
jgi:hypothetical protein